MQNKFKFFPLLALVLIGIAPVLAQESCRAQLAQILQSVNELCQDTAPGQVCVGGEITSLSAALSLDSDDVAVLRPEGEAATIVLFGDAELQFDAPAEWVGETYPNTQSFTLTTGEGSCGFSGALIQTPPGGEPGTVMINDVAITLGSTAFVQSSGGQTAVTTLAGVAEVSTDTTTTTSLQGTQVTVNAAGESSLSLADSDLLVPLVPVTDNLSDLLVSLVEDSAANETVQTLIDEDLLVPLVPPDDLSDLLVPLVPEDNVDDLLVPLVPENPQPATDRANEIRKNRARLPINGMWRTLPYEVETTGECVAAGGDNDGPGADYDPEKDPGYPLCGFRTGLQSLPYIVTQGSEYTYIEGSGNMYTDGGRTFGQVIRDRNGAVVGSVSTTQTMTYEVVSPGYIRVHMSMVEDGGCTQEASYDVLLVTANAGVCSPMGGMVIDIPQDGTPDGENEEEEIIDPFDNQTYTVSLMIPPDDQCNAENTPPLFDEVELRRENGGVVVDYGTGSVTLFEDIVDNYVYDSGPGTSRENINMFAISEGNVSLSWSKRVGDQNCYVMMEFTQPGMEPEPTEAAPTEDVPAGDTAIEAGTYTIDWMEDTYNLCTEELEAAATTFTSADVTVVDEQTISLDMTFRTFTLTYANGSYATDYLVEDGTAIFLMIQPGDIPFFSWTVMIEESGESCTLMAELQK